MFPIVSDNSTILSKKIFFSRLGDLQISRIWWRMGCPGWLWCQFNCKALVQQNQGTLCNITPQHLIYPLESFNVIQQGAQTRPTCRIQQCSMELNGNVESFWSGQSVSFQMKTIEQPRTFLWNNNFGEFSLSALRGALGKKRENNMGKR